MPGEAVIHIKRVKGPVTGRNIAFRLEAAVPNMDARKMKSVIRDKEVVGYYPTDERVPSFVGHRFICSDGDYQIIQRKHLNRFLDKLRWRGYDRFILHGDDLKAIYHGQ